MVSGTLKNSLIFLLSLEQFHHVIIYNLLPKSELQQCRYVKSFSKSNFNWLLPSHHLFFSSYGHEAELFHCFLPFLFITSLFGHNFFGSRLEILDGSFFKVLLHMIGFSIRIFYVVLTHDILPQISCFPIRVVSVSLVWCSNISDAVLQCLGSVGLFLQLLQSI